MTARRRHPVLFGLATGCAVLVAGTAVWGAVQLVSSPSTSTSTDSSSSDNLEALRNNRGDNSFLFAYLARNSRKPVRGDPNALAAFKTTRPSGALTALPTEGDPVRGTFSPVVNWPLIGIHAVLTPDGRVLTYGSSESGARTGYYVYDVWTPQLGLGTDAHELLSNVSLVDIFCNAQLLLPTGNIEMWGGDIINLSSGKSALQPTDDTNLFDPADNTLIRTGKMFRKRWYATATTLPNGEVYIQGGTGGEDYPEVRTSTGTFRLLTGAATGYINKLYPRNFLAPDGKIFGLTYSQMYRIDPSGVGTLTRVGKFSNPNIGGSSTTAMFRPGRILQLGGGNDSQWASTAAHIVNINPNLPVITAVPSLTYRRHWATATVMADGRVFVSGGSTANNDPVNGVAYTSEIFDPATNTWSLGPTAQQMRLYHSSSLLLPDATVLTLGGGANGPQLNLNAELYYPSYLFNADGSPAARPIISSAPMTTEPSRKVRIGTPDPTSIDRVTLVKAGSVTHSFDMDQRFIELPFVVKDDELEAQLPSNAFETPPGYYLLFVIDPQGVPSEAAIMRINVPQPTSTARLTVTKSVINDDGGSKTAADFSFSINGGSPIAFEADGSNQLVVPAGTYTITEPSVTGYTASLNGCSGIVLAAGETATCSIINNDEPVQNLLVNGDFEINSVPDGSGQIVSNLLGWKNKVGGIEVWRNNFGYTPGLNTSYIEVDSVGAGAANRIYQDYVTVAGATYEVSFLHSPRPGNAALSNRFDVYWNGLLIAKITREGIGLSNTSWQRATLVVTGTGVADRLSFRESDADDQGALIDDVRLLRR